jgi:hypothetical protein
VRAQATGGSEIPGLVEARNLRRVGSIVFSQSTQLSMFVCLSSYAVLSLLTMDMFVPFECVHSFSHVFNPYSFCVAAC